MLQRFALLWLSYRSLKAWLQVFGVVATDKDVFVTPPDPDVPGDTGDVTVRQKKASLTEALATSAATWLAYNKL